jgi:hypothetical protein
MSTIAFAPSFCNNPFQQFSRSFFDDPSLAFAKVLPAEIVEATFHKYDALQTGTFYHTAVVLWAFISQVLADGKSCTCSAAVSRIAAFFAALGHNLPSSNTGDYCNARRRLSLQALEELALLVANNTEVIMPSKWLWKREHHVKLVDGFTATMPDTEKNQREFPQHCQEPGCGFRWSAELDIRHVKRALNMDHFRCKSPEMVKREFWTMILGYNLVRKVICEAASYSGVLPRRLSFTQTCAFLLQMGTLWALMGVQGKSLEGLLKYLGGQEVPERPERYEPRVKKRRQDKFPPMKKTRHVLKKLNKSLK